MLAAFSAAGLMVNRGMGVTGMNRPVMWGFFITNFVFWIGISHAGVMLSAILRLSKAEWRRPATRAAEVLTVFSLMTAMLMPVVHTGRPWRTVYWIYTLPFVPFDYARGIWPNIRSPLVWDPSAVYTYLTSSILFVIVALIPDFAVLRDRTTGASHQVYSVLAMGWRGNARQWKFQIIAGVLLSRAHLAGFRLSPQHSFLGLRNGRFGKNLALHHLRPLFRRGRGALWRFRRGVRDDYPAVHLRLAGLHPPRTH